MNPLESMWNFFGQIGDTVLGGSPYKMAEGGKVGIDFQVMERQRPGTCFVLLSHLHAKGHRWEPRHVGFGRSPRNWRKKPKTWLLGGVLERNRGVHSCIHDPSDCN